MSEKLRTQELARALLHAQDRVARLHLRQESIEREKAALQSRVELLERSLAFRLGFALIDTLRSRRGMLALPGALRELVRDYRDRRSAVSQTATTPLVAFPEQPKSVLIEQLFRSARRPPERLADLRIAAVVDEFTRESFSPDCQLIELPSTGFEEQLDDFRPHLLFVESAWRGKNGGWMQKVHPLSSNLQYLVDCCRRRGIPTVFWNKEDPSHFENFLGAAALFDHVFTTDVDCIPRYRTALGHDRVQVLSFGCQPRIHNPVEHEERRDAASFAGSWYERYPERSRDFEQLVKAVSEVMPVDIYDRNAERGDPSFKFPERFAPMIRGSLPYAQIDKAYKGYRFGITLNTIKDSPSMFARRVYELLACNTIVLSNPALGLSKTFGDLVLVDDSPDFGRRLRELHASADCRHRLRLRGLRAVLGAHTSAHRLAQMASLVLEHPYEVVGPIIYVLARVRSPEQAKGLLTTYRKQLWQNKHLYLVVPRLDTGYEMPAGEHIHLISEAEAREIQPAQSWRADYVATLHCDDYYGTQYLVDLALATSYAPKRAVGKGRHYICDPAGTAAVESSQCYRESKLLLRAALVPSHAVDGSVLDWLDRMELEFAPTASGLAIDEFNYCQYGAGHDMTFVDDHQA